MGIETNARALLLTLANYQEKADDENRGRYQFQGDELVNLVGLKAPELNDAVEWLAKRGLLEAQRTLGSHPYSFRRVVPTTEGRARAENWVAESHGVTETDLDPLLAPLQNRKKLDAELRRLNQITNNKLLPLTLLMLDIDRFKNFNDSFGHQKGDEILKAVAATMSSVVSNKGTAYRYGGEELTVILENYSAEEARPIAERLRAEIEKIQINGVPNITVSLGGSTLIGMKWDANALLKAADEALYAAKTAGRNCVRWSTLGGPQNLSQ